MIEATVLAGTFSVRDCLEETLRLPARLRPRGTMRPLLGVLDGQLGAMRYGRFEISRSSASAACGLGR
jgi:hypothetical protein